MVVDKKELISVYQEIKGRIEKRLLEFKSVWRREREDEIFSELVFCILTPAARARSAGECLECLEKRNLLMNGGVEDISEELRLVRFKNNKARNIVEARKCFCTNGKVHIRGVIAQAGNNNRKREWLVSSVRGMGYKEASHFLRNIGFYEDLAILDRHILKNLKAFGLIEHIPESLTRKRYLSLEETMKELAVDLEIPLSHLDFLLWYRETGDIFK
ncbi:MAG: N-glycosylase/DNA lyase [Spirochaetota bacterium]|nr:MAG: N-glycosylase/DNA lyase [Spirochaetota bacterium]